MPRYINADDFLKKIEKFSLSKGTTLGKHSGVADEIIDILTNAPTEDVVPRSEVEKAKQEVAEKIINVIADLLWQGESEELNISIGGIYCKKQEFIHKIKKYIGETK